MKLYELNPELIANWDGPSQCQESQIHHSNNSHSYF